MGIFDDRFYCVDRDLTASCRLLIILDVLRLQLNLIDNRVVTEESTCVP